MMGGSKWAALRRRWWLAAIVAAAGLGGGGVYAYRRTRLEPRAVLAEALPAWQIARARAGSTTGGPAAQQLIERARRWPEVARGFDALDRAWPDDAALRAASTSVNQALAKAQLPYFVDAYDVGDRRFVLSFDLVARTTWQVGARSVDVVRLRRLDRLNVGLAETFTTAGGLPAVVLDRSEVTAARELPAMYGHTSDRTPTLNHFDKAALGQ